MPVKELLKLHEGLRLTPYRCTAGKLTIGYGRNLEDKGISDSDAERMLSDDIVQITVELDKRLSCMLKLNAVRRAVLIDMAFNLGVAGLMSFKKTLSHIDAGEYELASIEMLDSRWASQVGKRATRLSHMMRDGRWPDGIGAEK